jgi:hypothetical protein
VGSLFAQSSANSQANAANNSINTAGAYALADQNQSENAFQGFQSALMGLYGSQQGAIDAMAGPVVTNFHLKGMPGVATSPLGVQQPANVGRSWLGGK